MNSKGFVFTFVFVFFILAVLRYNLFHKLIFPIYEAEFNKAKAYAFDKSDYAVVNERIGFFRINAIVKRNEAVYLRVYSVSSAYGNGGPDLDSYGFVYKPDFQSCPFGDSNFELINMKGDWYSFYATYHY